MRIALWNLEPKIENTALMQISQFHKLQGDSVEWYSPLYYEDYDKIYLASLFSKTPKPKKRPKFITGGTGFDLTTRLPPEIETSDLDYSLYPNCKTSYLWFSRGCIHNCPYCVVPKKEGDISPVKHKNLNPNGKTITVLDNNPFVNPEWESMIEFLIGQDLRSKFDQLLKFFKPYQVQSYVLVEYWSTKEEDLDRIYWLKHKGIDPYVMPYKKTRYALDLARWCNTRKAIGSCDFEEYNRREYERQKRLSV
jgi:hypothetical protein